MLATHKKPGRPSVTVYVACLLLAMCVFIAAGFWGDRKAVARHKQQFNAQQALQVLLAQQALDSQIGRLMDEARILSGHSIIEYHQGKRSLEALKDRFRIQQMLHPEILACLYLTGPEDVLLAEALTSPQGREANEFGRGMASEHWGALTTLKTAPLVPPFTISERPLRATLLFPVRTGERLQGALVMVVDLGNLARRHFTPLRAGTLSRAVLLDGRGQILYAPEGTVTTEVGACFPVGTPSDKSITEASGTGDYDFPRDGTGRPTEWLVAWNTVRLGSQRLVIVHGAPASAVVADLRELRIHRILLGGMLGIILLLMSVFFFRMRESLLQADAQRLQDMVEQRTRELSAREEQYRILANNLKDVVIQWDTRPLPLYISPSITELSGYTVKEVFERIKNHDSLDYAWFMTPESTARLQALIRQRQEDDLNPNHPERQDVIEFEVIRKDGSPCWVETRFSFIWDKSGTRIGSVSVSRDISDRKRVEQEREHLVSELQEALAQVKTLKGFIPICASCKKIRNDEGYWEQLEAYLREHAEVEFSHGICPSCARKLYPELYRDEDLG